MLKFDVKLIGNPAKAAREFEDALRIGIANSMEELERTVTSDVLKVVVRGAVQATESVQLAADAIHDTAFEAALREYVRAITSKVIKEDGRIEVRIGVEDRVTTSGWSLPWLLRLLEYGGAAYIGGQTILLPPHPHWRMAAAVILKNRTRYAGVAGSVVAKAVLDRLRTK